MRLRGWPRFAQDVLRSYAESVFALDSAAPAWPLFSARFLDRVDEALGSLKGYSDHAAAADRWKALSAEARSMIGELADTQELALEPMHRAIARFTALMQAVHSDYPGFALRTLVTARDRIRSRQAGVQRLHDVMHEGAAIGGLVGTTLGFLMGSPDAQRNGASVSDLLQSFRSDAGAEGYHQERAWLSLERIDFDEERAGFGPVIKADDDGVVFPCPKCRKALKVPHARSALKGRCPCGEAGFEIPVSSLRRILDLRRQAWLHANGKRTCVRCKTETSAAGAYVNPFSVAGYCSRRCFEIDGARFHLPAGFRFRNDAFETSCACGAPFAFTTHEFRSVRPCGGCPLHVIIPDRADVEKASDKLCPTCSAVMAYAARTCRACLKAGRA